MLQMLSVNKDSSFLLINKQTSMEDLSSTFHYKHFIEESSPENYKFVFFPIACIICEKGIPSSSFYFYCHDCDFSFHKECPTTLFESNQTIDRPKTHEHTLTFIRKMNTFNCAACGRVNKEEMSMYGCLPCNFFVHSKCIYLPKVIKLTCHLHRLIHTFQVLHRKKCPICTVWLNYEYGGYICIDKTCDYKLHSSCATRKDIWDGKDVEREHGEMSNFEDAMFSSLEEVDDKIIRHFSHHHDLMRLYVNDEEEDARVCQACILPIDFDSFLGCKECDFTLHYTCASLPQKMEHTFHRHPLTLQVNVINIKEGFFSCSKCERKSCGFMYRCCQEECEFKMDAKCASLAGPLYNGVHQHPLTLLASGARCDACRFCLDPKRVTLPILVKCKYDIHPLTLSFYTSLIYWPSQKPRCEICEVKINFRDQDFYGCTDCNTTVHVECAIGKYPYLKPGHTIKLSGFEIEVASNSFSRPLCHACHTTCQDKLVFRSKTDAVSFCSIDCITTL